MSDGRDQEAIRTRVRDLHRELDAGKRELDNLRLEAERQRTALEGAVQKRSRSILLRVGLGSLVGPLIAVVVFVLLPILGVDSEGNETFYGVVTAVEQGGAAASGPVPVGARCTLFSSSDTEDDTAKFYVLCDGRLLYGGESYGWAACTLSDADVVRCQDPRETAQDGDPSFLFDRQRALAHVVDRGVTTRIELRPAPRALGGDG